ncbi:MAG TPA: hypothetical protein VFZ66_29445 [Herpetosiphonaceae bacterium]
MLKRYVLAALVVGSLGAAPLTSHAAAYFDGGGTIGSGTRSDTVSCNGMLGSGTCGSMAFLDDRGYFGSGH